MDPVLPDVAALQAAPPPEPETPPEPAAEPPPPEPSPPAEPSATPIYDELVVSHGDPFATGPTTP